jgi:hypothetical protein
MKEGLRGLPYQYILKNPNRSIIQRYPQLRSCHSREGGNPDPSSQNKNPDHEIKNPKPLPPTNITETQTHKPQAEITHGIKNLHAIRSWNTKFKHDLPKIPWRSEIKRQIKPFPYDLCLEKIQTISGTPIEVYKNEGEERDYVRFTNFNNSIYNKPDNEPDSIEIPVGSIDRRGPACEVRLPDTAFLGTSSNGEFTYKLGFARNTQTNEIKCTIVRSSYKDGSNDFHITDPEGKTLTVKNTLYDQSNEKINQSNKEIENILKSAKKMKFIKKS